MKICSSIAVAAFIGTVSVLGDRAEASDFNFDYGYYAGGLAVLCGLYLTEAIPSDIARKASIAILKKRDGAKDIAAISAFELISGNPSFKECPIRHP